MTPDIIQAACALGASVALYVLLWALAAAHRVPPAFTGRGC